MGIRFSQIESCESREKEEDEARWRGIRAVVTIGVKLGTKWTGVNP